MDNTRTSLEKALINSKVMDRQGKPADKPYDPEMLYVECKNCGRPILWEPGRTTSILMQSDISPSSIDEQCLILTDGCRECMPDMEGFHMSIVRLSSIPVSALMLMQKPAGNA